MLVCPECGGQLLPAMFYDDDGNLTLGGHACEDCPYILIDEDGNE